MASEESKDYKVDKRSLQIKETYETGKRFTLDGVFSDPLTEPNFNLILGTGDKVIRNQNNATVTLRRDRPGNLASGWGTKGTQAGAIDLVAGHQSAAIPTLLKDKDNSISEMYTDPNFKTDASRVYISQKSDVDEYFGLAKGSGNIAAKSAIGIKSDAVRVIGREGVKIVTSTDNKNSRGGNLVSVSGIDLIAGNNDTDLQPMVKGENLKKTLNDIYETIEDLRNVVKQVLAAQDNFNSEILNHTHKVITPLGAGEALAPFSLFLPYNTEYLPKSAEASISLEMVSSNIGVGKENALSPVGKYPVTSKWNKVN